MRLAPVALFVAAALAGGCQRPATPAPVVEDTPGIVPAIRTPWTVPREPEVVDEGPLPDELQQADIPQNRERLIKARAERLARARASTVDSYAKVGSRNAKWDKVAEDGLAKAAVVLANNYRDPDAIDDAWEALGAAVRLGCDDPAVRYLYLQMVQRRVAPGQPEPDNRELMAEVARALRDSRYPAIRRANGAHNLSVNVHRHPRTPEALAEALAHPDMVAVRDLLRAAWADDPRETAESIVKLAELTQSFCGLAHGGRRRAFEVFAEFVDGLPGAVAVGHWVRGQFLLDRAWAALGPAVVDRQVEDIRRTFVTNLEGAEAAFAAAWEADPTWPEVAVGLMSGAWARGDWEELEYWFRKAMIVDGDCVHACQVKGNFLHPKQGGHSDAVRQFAARLADTKNFHARLPYQGIQLILELRSRPDPHDVALPEADWPLVEGVFDDYLAARPNSRWAASQFLWMAWHNGHHAAALRAAERLDGRPVTRVISQKDYDGIRAAARASVAAGHP